MRLGILFLLLGAGCVEFAEQTLLLRYDAEADTVHLRLLYRGIYAGDMDKDDPAKRKKALDEALDQLREVAETKTRFYLLDNWPLGVDVAPPEEGKKDDPGEAMLRPHTTVRNGRFLFDEKGRLCAWQDVEFKEATKLLQKANQFISLAVMAGKVDVYKQADLETQRRLRKAAAKGHAWLRCDARGLSLHMPLSQADAVRAKREVLDDVVKELRKAVGKEENGQDDAITEMEALLRSLAHTRLELVHDEEGLVVRLPADSRGVVRVDWWNKGRYVPTLLEPLEQGQTPPELPAPIDRERKPDALVAGFVPAPSEGSVR